MNSKVKNQRKEFTFDPDEKIDKETILRKAKEEAENLMKNNNVDIAKDEKGNVTLSISLKK